MKGEKKKGWIEGKYINPVLNDLDNQLLMVKNSVVGLCVKTIFEDEKRSGTGSIHFTIVVLLAFRENEEYPKVELGRNAQLKIQLLLMRLSFWMNMELLKEFRDNGDIRIDKVCLTDKGKKNRSEFSQKRRKDRKYR